MATRWLGFTVGLCPLTTLWIIDMTLSDGAIQEHTEEEDVNSLNNTCNSRGGYLRAQLIKQQTIHQNGH